MLPNYSIFDVLTEDEQKQIVAEEYKDRDMKVNWELLMEGAGKCKGKIIKWDRVTIVK